MFYNFLRLIGIKSHKSFRLAIRFIALVVGLYCALMVAMLIHDGKFDIAEWWHFGVISAAVVEFVFADVLADRSFPFDTERKLALMEKRIGSNVIETISERLKETISEFRNCNTNLVSATVHIVAELTSTADQRIRKGLLQLTNYVGPEGGKKGRLTLITQGVIGRCARTGVIETVGFADENEYLREMVKSFGFTQEEAARHTKTGRSYLAAPLSRNGEVLGVLYFFTSELRVFPQAVDSESLKKVANRVLDLISVIGLA